MSTLTKPNHIGRKISRIRELRDMKTGSFGTGFRNQPTSNFSYRNSETIDKEKLIEVAKALSVKNIFIKKSISQS